MVSPGNAALLLDYDQYMNMDAINIPAQDPNFSAFSWPPLVQPHNHHQHQHQHHQQQQQQQQQQKQQTLNAFAHTATVSCPNFGAEIDGSFGECDVQKEPCSKKRGRSESCSASSSKACREKLRRDRLNDKFIELGSILEPGRTPKTDKAAILVDAVRMVTQLRGEAQKLRDSNSSLQEKIKELKAEKIELRDEKQRLKAEKEKLEHQLKAMSSQPSFMPAPPAIPAAFATQGQAPGNKLMPFIGYPGVAMWQFLPPAAVDTSQDHVLHPPVA